MILFLRIQKLIFIITLALFNIVCMSNVSEAYKPTKIVVEKVDVLIKNLPDEFENITIAHISDLHRSKTVEMELIDKTIDIVNNLKPDIIAITGDLANSLDYLKEALDHLNKLSAKIGTYVVLGNWENKISREKVVSEIQKSKLTLLYDECKIIEKNNSTIILCGLQDDNGKGQTLYKTMETVDNKLVKILLCHNPNLIENIGLSQKSIDLILSGHTHGGQVKYPIIGVFKCAKRSKYLAGLYEVEKTQLYVNRGIGVSKFGYRINCPPEVTLITLKKTN